MNIKYFHIKQVFSVLLITGITLASCSQSKIIIDINAEPISSGNDGTGQYTIYDGYAEITGRDMPDSVIVIPGEMRGNGTLRIGGITDTPVEADFTIDSLSCEKLPVSDKAQVSVITQEQMENGIIQGLYYKSGDNSQYYSYLTINGISYDFGYMGYGSGDTDTLERFGFRETNISTDTAVYEMQRLYGADSVTTAYYTITDGAPYLIYEINGWGIQKDIDGDGAIETAANTGTSTLQDFILYEWDIKNKSISHVRLIDALNCDIVSYLDNKNLFYTCSINKDTDKYGPLLAYEYTNGKFIRKN